MPFPTQRMRTNLPTRADTATAARFRPNRNIEPHRQHYTYNTVRTHIRSIYDKLGVVNRAGPINLGVWQALEVNAKTGVPTDPGSSWMARS